MNNFNDLAEMITKLKATSSSTKKKEILAQYPQCKPLLLYTYDQFKNYFITSDNIKKQRSANQFQGPNLFQRTTSQTTAQSYQTIFNLLDALNNRQVTGHMAARAVLDFVTRNKPHETLIFDIIDRDLKCRIDTKIINKVFPGLIPTFNVALANSYWDHKEKVDFEHDVWFASRKLDGCRLLTVVDQAGNVTCYSRNGKEFQTLQRIKDEVKEVWPELRGVVFDGEICIVDENGDEHFDWIMKEINRKNHTIAQPRYRIFDYLPLNEFLTGFCNTKLSHRLAFFDLMVKKMGPSKLIVSLTQTQIQTRVEADKLFQKSVDEGWEGLILRKDTAYQGKRSNDMLKMKLFHDEEFKVEELEFGPFRYVKDGREVEETMLSNVFIKYKGYKVGVGSGFTIAKRQYYFKHPEELKGKTITVKYFEETKNQDGGLSLRFPVIKHIYEKDRNV